MARRKSAAPSPADRVVASLFAAIGQEPPALEVRELGAVKVASGQVVVGDLVVESWLPALPIEVPAGEHPVVVALHGSGEEARPACALLLLASEPPARWELSWSFDVDSGLAGFADAETFDAYQEDDERLFERLQAALDRRDQGSWTWSDLKIRGKEGTLLVASTGWGDGSYQSWIGRDAAGAAVALALHYGLEPGDTARDDAPAAPPPPVEYDPGSLSSALTTAYNRALLGKEDPEELAELAAFFHAEAELTGERTARGRDAVVRALLDGRLLGTEPISCSPAYDLDGEDDGPPLALHVALMARASVERGLLRLQVEDGAVRRIAVELEEGSAPAAPSLAPEAVPADDGRLAEALGALTGKLSPLKRILIDDVRRQVLALRRPLSDEQRRRSRELLGIAPPAPPPPVKPAKSTKASKRPRRRG